MSSGKAIPLLFINLGGEMMYILDQRLQAQNIPKDKSMKVMNDIATVMLNERFLKELFKPQEVYNKQALRKLFQDLVHASIMRLNEESMDKLYDLMIMAFKYQLFAATTPIDLLLITLNHLDAIRDFVPSPYVQQQLKFAYMLLMETYAHLTLGELQTIRYNLLNFFQDQKIRVSVLLKDRVQNSDGKFVIPHHGPVPSGTEVPGTIRVFDEYGDLSQLSHFNPGGDYTPSAPPGSLQLHGERKTILGCNIYEKSLAAPDSVMCYRCHHEKRPITPERAIQVENPNVAVGQEELNMLRTQLLGSRASLEMKQSMEVIRLNLFSSDNKQIESAELSELQSSEHIVNIDTNETRMNMLTKLYAEMTVESPTDDICSTDLLDLMDSVEGQ